MTPTRDFKQTVVKRVERDPDFAKALLDEAATLFLSGEPDTARLILRDLVNATVGFENLADLTHKPSKSLHRMLSPKGNPSMDNLAVIFDAIRSKLNIGIAPYEEMKRWTLAVAAGRIKPGPNAPKLWFTSLKAAGNVFSEENRQLLRIIAKERPQSIAELEQLTHRKAANLSRTLKFPAGNSPEL